MRTLACWSIGALMATAALVATTGVSAGDTGRSVDTAPDAPPAVQATTFEGVATRVSRIRIDASSFAPFTTTVPLGSTVTWANTSARAHTVSARNGSFDSGILPSGAEWSFTATMPGTFEYICDLHEQMWATLVVTTDEGGPAAASTAPAPEAAAALAAPVALVTPAEGALDAAAVATTPPAETGAPATAAADDGERHQRGRGHGPGGDDQPGDDHGGDGHG